MEKLPPRLRALAELVPPGASLADIGTDHGYLPLALLAEGRITRAVGCDIGAGPLAAAGFTPPFKRLSPPGLCPAGTGASPGERAGIAPIFL